MPRKEKKRLQRKPSLKPIFFLFPGGLNAYAQLRRLLTFRMHSLILQRKSSSVRNLKSSSAKSSSNKVFLQISSLKASRLGEMSLY
jgi:hypothetical protein